MKSGKTKTARVSARDERGLMAALEVAAGMGAESVVEALRSVEWARRDCCDKAIALAYAKANRVAELRRLLANRWDWARLMTGEQSLASVAKHGSAACVAALIEAGLSPDDKSGAYEFPLLVATMYGSISCIKVLAARGVDMDWRNSDERSALGVAAHFPHVDGEGRWQSARALLAAGADPNLSGGPSGRTPLMLACASNHRKIAKMLVAAGADIEAVDADGRSALMWAAKSGSLGCVKMLLELGCGTDGFAMDGEDAQSWARRHGQGDCADAVALARAKREKIAMKSQLGLARRKSAVSRALSL